jgi:hypothetical protein
MAKSGVDGLRIVFRLELSFIDANEFLSFPRFFPETIVGNPVKPRRKTRFAAEAPKVFVSAQKSFLSQIIREGDIGSDQVAEQTSDGRLVIPDQLCKSVVVVINKDARNEVCICQRHVPMLGQRRRFVCVFGAFKFPDQQVPHSDEERDDADRPRAAFPVVAGPEENHQAESNHHQDHATAEIGAGANGWRGSEKRGRDGLAFCHHFANGPVKRSAPHITEEHDGRDDQDGSTEQRRKDNADNRDGHESAIIHIEIAVVVLVAVARRAGGAEMVPQFLGNASLDRILVVRRGAYRW